MIQSQPSFHSVPDDIWQLLEQEAERINAPAFIADDPVQFPRRFSSLPDIEIASLLAATIAWGNRRMICRDADRLLQLMENQPHNFVMDEAYEELPDQLNIHRTFFARNLKHFLRGLREVYSRFGSINDFARHCGVGASEAPAWELARCLNQALADANGGVGDSRCLPLNLRSTALKRLNMALRWLVRDDGIVDLGVWNAISPHQLYIPLDVHVGNTARDLGLLTRRAADRRAVEHLTALCRQRRPADPAWFDFALFGIGINFRR